MAVEPPPPPRIAVQFEMTLGPVMAPAISVHASMAHAMGAPILQAGGVRVEVIQLPSGLFGVRVAAPPERGPAIFEVAMHGHGGHWQSDHHVRTGLQQCQLAAANGEGQVSFFVPHPSCVRPEFERRQVPRTPAEPQSSQKGRLDSPNQKQHGVSMKPAAHLADERLGKPDPKRPLEAFAPQRAASLAAAAQHDAGLAGDHALYSEVRAKLFDGYKRDVAQRPQDAHSAFRQPEQCLKLDASATDFFGRPTVQRDLGLQRALFVSLLLAPMTLAEAKAMLQQHYGLRLGFDEGMLVKLAQAYGPSAGPNTSKEVASVSADRVVPEQMAAQQAKLKRERLPEEMLLQQQAELRSAPKKAAIHRRIDSLRGDERGDGRFDEPEEQEEREEEDMGGESP